MAELTVGEALEHLDRAEDAEVEAALLAKRARDAVREARYQLRRAREQHQPPIGAVIRFNRDDYQYAALRAGNGRWYTTGATCPREGYKWDELLHVISHNPITIVLPGDFRRWD